MSRKLIVCIFVALFLMTGCAVQLTSQYVTITDSVDYRLNALPSTWPAETRLQLVTVSAEGKTESLLLQSEAVDGQLNLVAMSHQGMSLFSISLMPDANFEMQTFVPGLRIYPSHILADMQLASWPLEDVQQALDGAEIRRTDTGREVVQQNTPIMVIEHGQNIMTIRHITRNYTITIEEIN